MAYAKVKHNFENVIKLKMVGREMVTQYSVNPDRCIICGKERKNHDKVNLNSF
jgi:hypothetical protein